MFQRRKRRTSAQKLREFFWPSMGLRRLGTYYKHRMGRLPGTPYFIAAGLASGVAVSFTPFVGLHILIGGAICWAVRGSFVSMVLGTLLAGNPWTFPVIWVISFKLGHAMLGRVGRNAGEMTDQLNLALLLKNPEGLLAPMTLGSLPLSIFFWILSFYICRKVVAKYKTARLDRILRKQL